MSSDFDAYRNVAREGERYKEPNALVAPAPPPAFDRLGDPIPQSIS